MTAPRSQAKIRSAAGFISAILSSVVEVDDGIHRALDQAAELRLALAQCTLALETPELGRRSTREDAEDGDAAPAAHRLQEWVVPAWRERRLPERRPPERQVLRGQRA